MPARRPGTVTAAAVMAMIYGILFIICGLVGVAALAAQEAFGPGFMAGNDPQQEKMQKELQEIIIQKVPAYQAIEIGGSIFRLVGAIAMLIGALSLLKMASWSRPFIIVWCFVIIATTVFQAVYQIAYVMPATYQAIDAALPGNLPQGAPQGLDIAKVTQTFLTMMFVLFLIFYLGIIIYLVIIICLLSGRRARLAFAGLPLSQEEDQLRQQSKRSREEDDDRDWGQPAPPDDTPINPKDDWRIR